jgi:hypothetical protein
MTFCSFIAARPPVIPSGDEITARCTTASAFSFARVFPPPRVKSTLRSSTRRNRSR